MVDITIVTWPYKPCYKQGGHLVVMLGSKGWRLWLVSNGQLMMVNNRWVD